MMSQMRYPGAYVAAVSQACWDQRCYFAALENEFRATDLDYVRVRSRQESGGSLPAGEP